MNNMGDLESTIDKVTKNKDEKSAELALVVEQMH